MSTIELKARVDMNVDGVTYAAGEWISLPEGQQARAQELIRYGLADAAKKPRRTRTTT